MIKRHVTLSSPSNDCLDFLSSSPLEGRAIAYELAAITPSRFFTSFPWRGEDSTARFLSFTKIKFAVRGGGDFGPLVPSHALHGDHPHLTTASLREAIVVLPPQGGGGETRQDRARLGDICDCPALEVEDSAGSIFVLRENRSGPREVGGDWPRRVASTYPAGAGALRSVIFPKSPPTPALPLKGGGRES
jgi:hypothetical protein